MVNGVVVLGPTAAGKTGLAVDLARRLAASGRPAEIISADSRQVYRGLDIGSGKDLSEYGEIPYHLIDVTELPAEYSAFDFQRDFYRAYGELLAKGALPVACGGTGMYLDSVLREYGFVRVPPNEALRERLAPLSLAELADRLLSLRPAPHNRTDLEERPRLVRAIEIAEYARDNPLPEGGVDRPPVDPVVLGVRFPRAELRARIRERLEARVAEGLVEEVARIHEGGIEWERLERLGLEYRFTAEFLQGRIATLAEYVDVLYTAICQFAKRQETWFRGMERKGVAIRWIDRGDRDAAWECVSGALAGT